jgi:hypothetical protein
MRRDDHRQINVRLPTAHLTALRSEAANRQVSVNRLVEAAVAEWLDLHTGQPLLPEIDLRWPSPTPAPS